MSDGKAIIRALALVDRGLALRSPQEERIQHVRPAELYVPPAVVVCAVDLPRMCALHQRPYMSRYLRNGDEFEYAQSIRLTDSLKHGQYGDPQPQQMDTSFLDHEHCTWCGAYSDVWVGPIACKDCKTLWCFGTTVRDYFRCPCGKGGALVASRRTEMGLIPGYRGRSSGGV